MKNGSAILLKEAEITSLLAGKEKEITAIVQRAYELHSEEKSEMPDSAFLRFPDNDFNRIIAKPAYLGGEFNTAGIKWISSFPDNTKKGLARASAILILNSIETGHPQSIMESSIISAKRTAASAALGAKELCNLTDQSLGLIGTGLINSEVLLFIQSLLPQIKEIYVFDVLTGKAKQFCDRVGKEYPHLLITPFKDNQSVLEKSDIISFATTAIKPYVAQLPVGKTVLHISLRDILPDVILSNTNIVDDIDHAQTANTSTHLAEQLVGHRQFIKATLADITLNHIKGREHQKETVIFSPFGLGVLDIALGDFVRRSAEKEQLGLEIDSFITVPA